MFSILLTTKTVFPSSSTGILKLQFVNNKDTSVQMYLSNIFFLTNLGMHICFKRSERADSPLSMI